MTDESWTDILTIFFVIGIVVLFWWLLPGCTFAPSIFAQHTHSHYHDKVEPPAEVVFDPMTIFGETKEKKNDEALEPD